MQGFISIFTSEVSYDYTTELPPEQVLEKVSTVGFWADGRSARHYSIHKDPNVRDCTVIRRGFTWPMIIKITAGHRPASLVVSFRGLISPLFLLAPVFLSMWPYLNRSSNTEDFLSALLLFFASMFFMFLIALLFCYLPVRSTQKRLESTLGLKEAPHDNL